MIEELHIPIGHTLRRADCRPLVPLFVPFAGCAGRCVYCDQRTQTGSGFGLEGVLARLETELATHAAAGREVEVGVYGGSFTAAPASMRQQVYDALAPWRQRGVVTHLRCSTRPELAVLTPDVLAEFAEAGGTTVELGVQTFADPVLAASGRTYTGDEAEQACAAVRAAGLSLVVQLLPGLPGHVPAQFCHDVQRALACTPAGMRLYPCVVVAGTELAARYERGEYTPWSLDVTLHALGEAMAACWGAGVRVLRTGLAPEQGMDTVTLAGPVHPALGQRVRSRALVAHICHHADAAGMDLAEVHHPPRLTSDLRGWRGELAPLWQSLGKGGVRLVPHPQAGSAPPMQEDSLLLRGPIRPTFVPTNQRDCT